MLTFGPQLWKGGECRFRWSCGAGLPAPASDQLLQNLDTGNGSAARVSWGDTAPETSGFSASGENGRVFSLCLLPNVLLFGVVWVPLFRVISSFTTPLLRIIRYGSHKRADDAQKWRRWCWGGAEKWHPNDAEKSHPGRCRNVLGPCRMMRKSGVVSDEVARKSSIICVPERCWPRGRPYPCVGTAPSGLTDLH